MTLGTMQTMSKALQRSTTYMINLPDPQQAGPGPYPVLLQLHGYLDDCTAWVYKSNILRYLERLPLIVVFPSGENAFWTDWEPTRHYESLLVEDLWAHVNATYAVRPGPWAIGGLSMGGFGAIRLGLKYPDKFASIYAHSSVIPDAAWHAERFGSATWWSDSFKEQVRTNNDIYHWAAALTPATLPRLGFDCGVDDNLIGHNRHFHAFLTKRGLPHTYAEHPGGHDWAYWDTHIHAALAQHCAVLGIAYRPEATPDGE